jgi:hypothetical protein
MTSRCERLVSTVTMRPSHSGSGEASKRSRTWWGNSISTPGPVRGSSPRRGRWRRSGTNRVGWAGAGSDRGRSRRLQAWNKDPRPEAVVLGRPLRGAISAWEPPLAAEGREDSAGVQAVLEVLLTLTVLPLLLLADVLPHAGLIQPHPADAGSRRPEVQSRHPTLVKPLPMDPNRALPLQEANRVRHAGLGRDAPAPMDGVGHLVPFHQFDPPLTAQVPQDRADRSPQPSVDDFSAVLGHDHDVGLALPPHMGPALPWVQRLLVPAPRGLPGRRSLGRFVENARRIARSSLGPRPEAVVP